MNDGFIFFVNRVCPKIAKVVHPRHALLSCDTASRQSSLTKRTWLGRASCADIRPEAS
jgi:hypothetical protein